METIGSTCLGFGSLWFQRQVWGFQGEGLQGLRLGCWLNPKGPKEPIIGYLGLGYWLCRLLFWRVYDT